MRVYFEVDSLSASFMTSRVNGVPLAMLASDWFSCYCCHCFVRNKHGGIRLLLLRLAENSWQRVFTQQVDRLTIFKFDNAGMKDTILYILLINNCLVFKKRSKGGPKEGKGGFRAKSTEALYG